METYLRLYGKLLQPVKASCWHHFNRLMNMATVGKPDVLR